jgi:hypothetical protein
MGFFTDDLPVALNVASNIIKVESAVVTFVRKKVDAGQRNRFYLPLEEHL